MAHSLISPHQMQHLIQLLVYAAAVLVAARIVPGIHVRSFGSALLFALVFAIVDKLLFGVLLLLGLPLVVLTLGFFVLVINAVLFLIARRLTPGVDVDSFGAAFLGALVSSIVSSLALWALGF